MDPSNKNEWVAARQELKSLLDVDANEDDVLREAYANLPADAWVHHCSENVVKSPEYARMDSFEAAKWLSTVHAVARLVQDRLQRRFDLVVCASTNVWPYFDSAGEHHAVVMSTHTITVADATPERIADELATLVRMEAADDHDTLFFYELAKPVQKLNLAGLARTAEAEAADLPKFLTRFATARRKV